MKLTVVGCGDAFGSGGRLQTCYHVEDGPRRFLIDCGATALIGLNRLQIDPNSYRDDLHLASCTAITSAAWCGGWFMPSTWPSAPRH